MPNGPRRRLSSLKSENPRAGYGPSRTMIRSGRSSVDNRHAGADRRDCGLVLNLLLSLSRLATVIKPSLGSHCNATMKSERIPYVVQQAKI